MDKNRPIHTSCRNYDEFCNIKALLGWNFRSNIGREFYQRVRGLVVFYQSPYSLGDFRTVLRVLRGIYCFCYNEIAK